MEERIQQCVETNLFGKVCDYCDGGIVYKVLGECVEILTILIGAFAVIGIIIVGIMYLTSAGDVARQTKAKRRLAEIAIGLLCYGVFFGALEFLIPGGVLNSTLDTSTTSCPPPEPTYYTEPQTSTPGDPSTPSTPGEHGTRSFTMCSMEFDVIKIQVDGVADDGTDSTGLKKFIRDKVQKYHINQSDGKVYNLDGSFSSSSSQDGHCDAVSRNLAYDMYFDTITADSCSAGGRDPRKSGFTTTSGDSGFKKTYDAIMAGKPVVHRVTINDGQGNAQRHYAVIVGVKKGADRNHLTNSDFLFLETWGGGVLWNNISGVTGGWRTNSGGSGCTKTTRQNRFPYDTYFFEPSSKTGEDRKDC